jgi:hypothetical protein
LPLVKYLQIRMGAVATAFLIIKCRHSKNIPLGMFLTKRYLLQRSDIEKAWLKTICKAPPLVNGTWGYSSTVFWFRPCQKGSE